MSDNTKGQCLCGAVKFEGIGKPSAPHACHCRDCVRWTGGAFLGVLFDGGIAVEDESKVNWFQSSEWGERGSCKSCGATLFWRLQSDHKMTNVTAGSLDDQAAINPIDEHIFIDKKPAYYDFSGDAHRLTAAETLARHSEGSAND